MVAAISLYATSYIFDVGLPWSVPIIFAAFTFLSVGGMRFLARRYFRNPNYLTRQPVIIYGAGEAGLQLLNALFHGQEFAPVALIDDDPYRQNLDVGGLRVYSPSKIPRLAQETGAQVILLAIPSMDRARFREIVSTLEDLHLEIKTIPIVSDIS